MIGVLFETRLEIQMIWHAWFDRVMLTWLMEAVLNSDPHTGPQDPSGASDVLSYMATTAESVYCKESYTKKE